MKFLHTMIRVGNLEKSIKFYTENFGMKLIRQKDYPGGKFTLAFIGYGDEADNTVIELTHNWETDSYDIGNGFGHFALGVEDIYSVCDKLREDGVIITREPGPMKHGTTVIAFVKDPDGYSIELIERK
ncbi:Glyoxalase I [Lentisphaera araneosa HTCC2155]|uniref:Lactoylglutathione lyase n=1 Tax=Lentisphaera araneosa HTCC2155 TaxID=313628 RepID=A6DS38_9BACT|nr:lactoylglutathione lyase [Lentisphaera araneosa]EDM25498.1 Glyoxalase I [Lentisphaera araneosa HTCC2155]